MHQTRTQVGLPLEDWGEASKVGLSGEVRSALHGNGRSGTDLLMDVVAGRNNVLAALKRVARNKGSPGSDGMAGEPLRPYLRENGGRSVSSYLAGPTVQARYGKWRSRRIAVGCESLVSRRYSIGSSNRASCRSYSRSSTRPFPSTARGGDSVGDTPGVRAGGEPEGDAADQSYLELPFRGPCFRREPRLPHAQEGGGWPPVPVLLPMFHGSGRSKTAVSKPAGRTARRTLPA